MGRVDDIPIAPSLTRAAQRMRPAVAAFADAVSEEKINLRKEQKKEMVASDVIAKFEKRLEATNAAADKMATSDKNLSEGIRAHANAIADDYAVDLILYQRAKIKFNSRKRHYESRPMVERVLVSPLMSPRAKKEDVLQKEQDPRSPFAGGEKDGVLPAEPRNAKDITAEPGMSLAFLASFVLALLLAGLAIAVAMGARFGPLANLDGNVENAKSMLLGFYNYAVSANPVGPLTNVNGNTESAKSMILRIYKQAVSPKPFAAGICPSAFNLQAQSVDQLCAV